MPASEDESDLWDPSWGEPHVAPDGSLWVPARLGVWGDRRRPVCDHGIGGVVRIDGVTQTRFLRGHCVEAMDVEAMDVEAMDVAADGSVWLLASASRAKYPVLRTYVITPEAVAGGE